MRRALLTITVTASLLTSGPVLLDPLWHLLSSVWGAMETPDEGCIGDPSGRCLPAPQPDAGCIGDPSGRCLPAPQPDAGCIGDPDGLCLPASQPDEGCIGDPNGCPQGS